MAQFWEYIKIALMNIKSNKGRSLLTMLGIIIGISSVIMIISIGNGVKGQINGELNAMAGGQLYMYIQEDNEMISEFTIKDFQAIEENVEHVKGVTPQYSLYGRAIGRKDSFECNVSAGTNSLEYISKDPIIRGKYFSENDYYVGNKVCVIKESGARSLFGTTDVIGMSIEVEIYGSTQELTIVGIRQDNESSLISGMMYGNATIPIEMPISVLGSSYGFYVEGFDGAYIIGESGQYSSQIAKDCISLMESRYNIRGDGAILMEDFNDSLSQVNNVLGYITLFVVFVAAISLLVGGIGVMNIMLVSVTERTREIGIRKALGARTNSIMLQFLSESAIITLLGGIIGIIIGVIGAKGVCSIMNITAYVEPSTVFLATLFSSAVGIFFGIYPAKKAAKLSPIEALRHE
ncbi:MAG TPA: ABC transporter permease [Lachnospiraceae bacterium]|nr:ABC transporter permease [Lachnospiraceae bacterium]